MFTFLRKQYFTLNKIEISRSAIEKNHATLKKLQDGKAICPVLKSNAYGHGLRTVAPIFDRLRPAFLAVDSLYEAYELYKMKLKTPIHILGYTDPRNYAVKKLPFHFTIFDLASAQSLSTHQPGCPVHIFVDTGMHREGITLEHLEAFVIELKKMKLNIVGLASHLADADNPESQNFTKNQMKRYTEALTILNNHHIYPEWRHIAASGGSIKVQDDTFNLIRGGLASYGISPLAPHDRDFSKLKLIPALTLKSHIAQVKTIPANGRVGYNGTFTAKKDMKIAILPIGYFDGIDRRLSNKGVVQIYGKNCPIIGRISMNIVTVDVSNLPHVAAGDEVVVFSHRNSDQNSIIKASETAQTIPYDLLVGLAESIRREIVA